MGATKLDEASAEREYARKLEEHALWLAERGYYGYAADEKRLAEQARARADALDARGGE